MESSLRPKRAVFVAIMTMINSSLAVLIAIAGLTDKSSGYSVIETVVFTLIVGVILGSGFFVLSVFLLKMKKSAYIIFTVFYGIMTLLSIITFTGSVYYDFIIRKQDFTWSISRNFMFMVYFLYFSPLFISLITIRKYFNKKQAA